MMLAGSDEKAFADRGLDFEAAVRMGAKFERGKFLFEYTRNEKFSYRKIRFEEAGRKKFYIEPTGQKLHLWNIDTVPLFQHRTGESLVICEGEFDAIAVFQAIGGYVLSVPNGVVASRTEGDIAIADDSKFAYLWSEDCKLIPQIDQFDKIVLCVDGDEAGQILRDELAMRIGDTRCWTVSYPENCKDANEVLCRYGEEAVEKLIDGARPIRSGHLTRPSQVPNRMPAISYSTGWSFLDKHMLIQRQELILVTGQPGHGKGQFIRALTFHLAEAHGWKTAFLTPEDPPHRVIRDMRRFALRNTPYATPEQQKQALDWIDEHFRIATPPEDEPITLEMLEREIESAALHHDCQVFVLDPWNELEHAMRKGEDETGYIGRILRRINRKKRRYNMIIIIAAHPTKLKPDEEASLYKMAGSANWKNKCEHGLIIIKPSDYSNSVRLIVEKSKDWETMGRPGEVWMEFIRDKCDYVQVMNQD